MRGELAARVSRGDVPWAVRIQATRPTRPDRPTRPTRPGRPTTAGLQVDFRSCPDRLCIRILSPMHFTPAVLDALTGRYTVVKAPARPGPPAQRDPAVVATVSEMLRSIEANGIDAVRKYAE